MPLVLADRVKVRTRTIGTDPFLIENTFQGFQGFDAIGDGNETYYAVFDNIGNWEIGRGFYSSSAQTLSRSTIIDSSNSGVVVDFPAGGKTLFVTVPSALLDVVLSGVSDSFKFISVSGQPSVTADNPTDSLIFEGGQNVFITTDPVFKKVTFTVNTEKSDFDLNVAADDSTVRNIGLGETIKFIGGLNISTSSDDDGNITITGPDVSGFALSSSLSTVATSGAYNDLTGKPTLSTVATSGSYNDLLDLPDLTSIGSLEITGSAVDSNDSSEISFVPSVRFNSDVTIENELIVNAGIRGNVIGDISGNITGNISGDITGDLTGDVTGNLTGNVFGNLTGNVFGNLTGNVVGNLTGDVTGNITTSIINSSDSSAVQIVTNANFFADVNVDNDLTVSSVANLLGDTFLSRTYEQTHAVNNLSDTLYINDTDQERGSVYYLTNVSANFTVDFTNIVLSDTKTISYALMVVQGGTAYMPTTVKVNGVTSIVKWNGGGGTPIGNPNYIDVISITIVVNSGAVTQVLASLSFFA